MGRMDSSPIPPITISTMLTFDGDRDEFDLSSSFRLLDNWVLRRNAMSTYLECPISS